MREFRPTESVHALPVAVTQIAVGPAARRTRPHAQPAGTVTRHRPRVRDGPAVVRGLLFRSLHDTVLF